MTTCRICNSDNVQQLLDLGPQPVCNRFLKSKEQRDAKYHLILGLCRSCGLVQLIHPFPSEKLKPVYDWVTYKEPEDHLDKVADMFVKLLSKKDAKICGVTYKDDSTLERLKKRGFKNAIKLGAQKNLGSAAFSSGAGAFQSVLKVNQAQKIVQQHGKFDLIISRHVLEHVYDVFGFMDAIKQLLKPQGHVLFEVPDYTKSFGQLDYSTIWEEHLAYFTPETFKNCFSFCSLETEIFKAYPYQLENSLVAVVKNSGNSNTNPKFPDENILERETIRALNFSREYAKTKNKIKSFFSEFKKNNGKIAVYGAGHNACMLINAFELEDYIDCVIDDNANKQGLFMPGSHLPILSPSALLDRGIKLSVFSLNPGSEEQIVAKNQEFIKKGGIFLSFCPVSSYSIMRNKNSGDNNFREMSKEVYYSVDDIAKLSKKDINFLKEKMLKNNLQRIRICAHKGIKDKIHEMFIVLRKNNYIRPHRHLNKSESFHLVEGNAKIVVFDNDGNIKDVICVDSYDSGKKFYYRMNNAFFHTVLPTSDFLIFHETVQGPFRKEDTVFAPWAPKEGDKEKENKYRKQILGDVCAFLSKKPSEI